MALSPSLAVPTSCAPSARASRSWSLSAARGSSSAMSTRSGSTSAIRLHRHCERHLVPAAGHGAKTAARAGPPARFKALADIGEAEACSFVGGGWKVFLAAMFQPVADLKQHAMVVEMLRLD